MGYACPVCDAPQIDGVHLANHLAVTASLDRPDHREWLAEYAPDWRDCGPEELAERVVTHAPEAETPDFETDAGGRPDVGFEEQLAAQSRQPGRGGPIDAASRSTGTRSSEVAEILDEARELTESMTASGADGAQTGTDRANVGDSRVEIGDDRAQADDSTTGDGSTTEAVESSSGDGESSSGADPTPRDENA
ncbi:DUF5810 domain-containing protein [Halovivax gelatinilyticus]|uniref:DUF5810 domain-containing protein n=1 Tax=Halovivax gelatinilyticus TaxID=2961597 RepID=UPI003CCE4D72